MSNLKLQNKYNSFVLRDVVKFYESNTYFEGIYYLFKLYNINIRIKPFSPALSVGGQVLHGTTLCDTQIIDTSPGLHCVCFMYEYVCKSSPET